MKASLAGGRGSAPQPRRGRGVGLIELLIALVVVSLGVISLARLQIGMSQTNQQALLRTQASLLAYDMVDRLRADRFAALAGDYDLDLDDDPPTGSTFPEIEVAGWLTTLEAQLPAADGEIARNGNVFEVVVSWDDSRGAADAQVFRTETVL